jgi:preprotein translocase subunit SecB
MNKAAFKLDGYLFDKVFLDLSNLQPQSTFDIDFAPSGVFHNENKSYELTFIFSAKEDENKNEVVKIRCVALFSFNNINSIDDIPEYFYTNAIAILFPYIRAFVGTLTLQANFAPIVLPTLNLSDLKDVLKKSTVQQ